MTVHRQQCQALKSWALIRTCKDLLEPQEHTLSEETAKALLETFKNCETNAEKLHKIFEKTIARESEGAQNRYLKVTKRLGKGSKAEDLIKAITEDAQAMTNLQLVKDARPDLRDKLDAIIMQMDELEPSLPEADNAGNVFHTYGGTMNNSLNYGSGSQHTGSGDVFNISGLSGNPPFIWEVRRLLHSANGR